MGPYHGWVIAYDARTLKQAGVFNTSPDAEESGIWQGDTGPAADEEGNVYVSTGNGKFDAFSGGHDYGDSVLKLGLTSSGLAVKDYFTPFDEARLNITDADLGSGGPLLVPEQPGSRARLLVVGRQGSGDLCAESRSHGKISRGGQQARDPNDRSERRHHGRSGVLEWAGVLLCERRCTEGFRSGRRSPIAATGCASAAQLTNPATPTVSANGLKDGIIWLLETEGGPAVLRAYEATNVANEIYSSNENSDRDRAGGSCRFAIPTVIDGRVYVGASGEVDVYGLLAVKHAPPTPGGTRRRRH